MDPHLIAIALAASVGSALTVACREWGRTWRLIILVMALTATGLGVWWLIRSGVIMSR